MVKPSEIVNALAGTYTLLNNTVYNLTTSTQIPSSWGLAPSGHLTYTRYGYMSAVMAASQPEWRPTNVRWPPKDSDPASSWELIARHSLSYAGPFGLNASVENTKTEGQLLHGPVQVASVPVMMGEVQARNYAVHTVPVVGSGGGGKGKGKGEEDGEEEEEVYLNVWLISQGLRSEIWWRRIVKG